MTSLDIKFIYSEKATKFCEISTLLFSYVVPVKSKVEISQIFVAFSEYMNFKKVECNAASKSLWTQCGGIKTHLSMGERRPYLKFASQIFQTKFPFPRIAYLVDRCPSHLHIIFYSALKVFVNSLLRRQLENFRVGLSG